MPVTRKKPLYIPPGTILHSPWPLEEKSKRSSEATREDKRAHWVWKYQLAEIAKAKAQNKQPKWVPRVERRYRFEKSRYYPEDRLEERTRRAEFKKAGGWFEDGKMVSKADEWEDEDVKMGEADEEMAGGMRDEIAELGYPKVVTVEDYWKAQAEREEEERKQEEKEREEERQRKRGKADRKRLNKQVKKLANEIDDLHIQDK